MRRAFGLGGFGFGTGRAAAAAGPRALTQLSLSASSIAETAANGTVIGAIHGARSGSSYALQDSAGGKFDISGGNVRKAAALDYEAATSHDITIRETNAGYPNSPRDTVLAIAVTNVLEITLGALSLDNDTCEPTDTQGTLVGTIGGGSVGSTVTLLSQSTANAFQKDGSDIEVGPAGPLSEGEYTITLRETHADASNSPNDTVIPITANHVPTPGNELWVQPAFDASAGVTLLGTNGVSVPTISTGKLRCTVQDDGEEGVQPGRARATALETLVVGVYRVEYTIDSIGSNMGVSIAVAGGGQTTTRSTVGTFTEDIQVVSVSNQFIIITMDGETASQQVVIDNVSLKQLT